MFEMNELGIQSPLADDPYRRSPPNSFRGNDKRNVRWFIRVLVKYDIPLNHSVRLNSSIAIFSKKAVNLIDVNESSPRREYHTNAVIGEIVYRAKYQTIPKSIHVHQRLRINLYLFRVERHELFTQYLLA